MNKSECFNLHCKKYAIVVTSYLVNTWIADVWGIGLVELSNTQWQKQLILLLSYMYMYLWVHT